jgi:capsular exopolysaccharide synthesis family protein
LARTLLRHRGSLIDPNHHFSEPFRTLRLAIELRPEASSRGVLIFTSPQAGDGKSTVAANYALVAALALDRVLLVDADLRNPSLHEYFEVPRAPGLVEALRDDRSLEDVARRSRVDSGVELVTAGAPLARPGDVGASEKMGELIAQARETYDLLVFDTPPLSAAADAAGLSAHPGTEVAVVVDRNGKRRPLMQALRQLDLVGANVLGLVVNRDGRMTTYTYY